MWEYLNFSVSIMEKPGICYGSVFQNCRSKGCVTELNLQLNWMPGYLFVMTVAPCIEMSIKLLAIHSICQQMGEGCDLVCGCSWECLLQHHGAEEN